MKKRFIVEKTAPLTRGHYSVLDLSKREFVSTGTYEDMVQVCANENEIHDRHRLYLRFCRLGYNLTAAMSIWFIALLALFILVDDPVEMTITAACIFFMNLIISLLDSILFEPEDL